MQLHAMSRRLSLTLLLVLAIGGLAGCASTPATASASTAPVRPIASPAGKVPVFAVGTTAEAIQQQLGQPAAIRPMDAPEGKADVWVYELDGPVKVTQVITGMRSVPVASAPGSEGQIRLVDEPIYSRAEQRTTVTLELLIMNGVLVAQKGYTDQAQVYR
jgi:hypothetical protein